MRPFDLSGLRTYDLHTRPSKVSVADLGRPADPSTPLADFLDTLPRQLAANELRKVKQPDGVVSYIVDRNINYTNVCVTDCKFCAFYRRPKDDEGYVLSYEEIGRKIDETKELGGVQILMQGGHHPGLKIDYYLELLNHIRTNHPTINIHGFSPPEFNHFASVFNMSLEEVIVRFKEAGLGSIPGGGGEILVDAIRNRISPRKCTGSQWLEVMRIAHRHGLNSSATMMFGHVETCDGTTGRRPAARRDHQPAGDLSRAGPRWRPGCWRRSSRLCWRSWSWSWS